MVIRAAIVAGVVIAILIVVLAAYGYGTRMKPNPPTVPPEPPSTPSVR